MRSLMRRGVVAIGLTTLLFVAESHAQAPKGQLDLECFRAVRTFMKDGNIAIEKPAFDRAMNACRTENGRARALTIVREAERQQYEECAAETRAYAKANGFDADRDRLAAALEFCRGDGDLAGATGHLRGI